MSVRSHTYDGLGYSTDAFFPQPTPPGPPSTNLLAGWDADHCYSAINGGGTLITADGALASLKNTASSSDVYLNQSTTTAQFQFRASGGTGPNGYAYISATDHSRFMAGTFSIAEPFTVYLLTRMTNWTVDCAITNSYTGDYNPYTVEQAGGSSPYLRMRNSSNGPTDGNMSLNNWHLIMAVFNGASSFLKIDNNADSTGDIGSSSTISGFVLGYRNGGSTYNAQVDHREIQIYSVAHASGSGDGLAVRQYLNTKYNLGLSI